ARRTAYRRALSARRLLMITAPCALACRKKDIARLHSLCNTGRWAHPCRLLASLDASLPREPDTQSLRVTCMCQPDHSGLGCRRACACTLQPRQPGWASLATADGTVP